ncbi:MAG TPA: ATP-binding protein [Polyangiaceae bacterium]|nr:ATP-binding protein [Polyangiaceae bacterium]
MMQAIGRNHSFESAVADIVDNSLDAGASKVLVRFVRDHGELLGVYIVDNGKGMGDAEIDRAMTFGGRRDYANTDLGHFGIGLKAASLGQAKSVTVLSGVRGEAAVGRRLIAEKVSATFECEVLASAYAAEMLGRPWADLSLSSGSIVIWSELKATPAIGSVDAFLEGLIANLNRHLGLVFHRLIVGRGVQISLDQEDIGHGATGAPLLVIPLDPFGYAKSGRLDYPRKLRASSEHGEVELTCHIWPGRSNDANFKLAGIRPTDAQGLYVYKNDRLIQRGGWHGIASPKDEFQLARIAVDVGDGRWFELNPEKTQVGPTASFKALARRARDDEVDLAKYLADAEQTYRASRKRVRERPKVIAPGAGLAPSVKSAISDEYDFVEGRAPLEIRWAEVDNDQFFAVDKDANLIRLNRRFRSVVLGNKGASLNDAPLVKALLYLLAESALRGEVLGPRDKDNLSIWQAVLSAAVKAELK